MATTRVARSADVVAAGVDWLSMSCDAPSGIAALLSYRDNLVRGCLDAGFKLRPWGGHGYVGIRIEHCRFAVGRAGVLVQLSSERARRDWRLVVQHSSNVSRIDLATTVRADPGAGSLARGGYQAVTRSARGAGRPIGYALLQTSTGADTLYVGSRASDQFGRLYDKGRESGDAALANCWRYEVEYKRRPALDQARALYASEAEALTVAGTCHRWFAARRIDPVYRPGELGDAVSLAAPVADDTRWLEWVRRCVQPRAREMVKRYGWRFIAETCAGHITTVEEYLSWSRGIEYELEVRDVG